MTIAEYLAQCLTPYGWKPLPVFPGSVRDARLMRQSQGALLEIDHRPARRELWLWIVGKDWDKRCIGFEYEDKLQFVLQAIVTMQDKLKVEDYFGAYFEFQKVGGKVAIIAWEQFPEPAGTQDTGFNQEAAMAQAQAAHAQVASGGGGDPDPVVFPGQRVAKLSDYVAIMKRMQTGDMMGALGAYGLDMMGWGSVAAAWGGKLGADPTLNAKFTKMLMG